MSIEIKSPTFPESVADGTVANWVKKEGESVEQDEVIAEIETDKATMEVESADEGTIRKDFASSLSENAVHGSDSDENALKEINFFFSGSELI